MSCVYLQIDLQDVKVYSLKDTTEEFRNKLKEFLNQNVASITGLDTITFNVIETVVKKVL